MPVCLASYLAALLLNLAQLWARESAQAELLRVSAAPPFVRAVSGVRLALSVLGPDTMGLSLVGERWQLQAADERQHLFPGTRPLLQLSPRPFPDN